MQCSIILSSRLLTQIPVVFSRLAEPKDPSPQIFEDPTSSNNHQNSCTTIHHLQHSCIVYPHSSILRSISLTFSSNFQKHVHLLVVWPQEHQAPSSTSHASSRWNSSSTFIPRVWTLWWRVKYLSCWRFALESQMIPCLRSHESYGNTKKRETSNIRTHGKQHASSKYQIWTGTGRE